MRCNGSSVKRDAKESLNVSNVYEEDVDLTHEKEKSKITSSVVQIR